MTRRKQDVFARTCADAAMIYHRFYEAPEDDIADLIANQLAGRLISVAVAGHLRNLLSRYQPEGGYVGVDAGDPMTAILRGGFPWIRAFASSLSPI